MISAKKEQKAFFDSSTFPYIWWDDVGDDVGSDVADD